MGINCYQPSTCQKVIDDMGGPFAPSTAIAQALGDCGAGAGCGSLGCAVAVPL